MKININNKNLKKNRKEDCKNNGNNKKHEFYRSKNSIHDFSS